MEKIKKVSGGIETEMGKLKRDGTIATFNKSMELLGKKGLTEIQRDRILKSAQCIECGRVYCDHQRD